MAGATVAWAADRNALQLHMPCSCTCPAHALQLYMHQRQPMPVVQGHPDEDPEVPAGAPEARRGGKMQAGADTIVMLASLKSKKNGPQLNHMTGLGRSWI